MRSSYTRLRKRLADAMVVYEEAAEAYRFLRLHVKDDEADPEADSGPGESLARSAGTYLAAGDVLKDAAVELEAMERLLDRRRHVRSIAAAEHAAVHADARPPLRAWGEPRHHA